MDQVPIADPRQKRAIRAAQSFPKPVASPFAQADAPIGTGH